MPKICAFFFINFDFSMMSGVIRANKIIAILAYAGFQLKFFSYTYFFVWKKNHLFISTSNKCQQQHFHSTTLVQPLSCWSEKINAKIIESKHYRIWEKKTLFRTVFFTLSMDAALFKVSQNLISFGLFAMQYRTGVFIFAYMRSLRLRIKIAERFQFQATNRKLCIWNVHKWIIWLWIC